MRIKTRVIWDNAYLDTDMPLVYICKIIMINSIIKNETLVVCRTGHMDLTIRMLVY